MATTAQVDAIVALYAGYFNRAPDPAGLQFWIDQIDGGREFNTIAADFAASPEATAVQPRARRRRSAVLDRRAERRFGFRG